MKAIHAFFAGSGTLTSRDSRDVFDRAESLCRHGTGADRLVGTESNDRPRSLMDDLLMPFPDPPAAPGPSIRRHAALFGIVAFPSPAEHRDAPPGFFMPAQDRPSGGVPVFNRRFVKNPKKGLARPFVAANVSMR